MTGRLNKLAAAEPMTVDYYNSLGLLYASQQKHRKATWAFQKALDLDSGCAEAFYNQALSLTAQGHLDQAIDSYTNATRIRPDFQEAYYNLGNVLKKIGFIEKAIENYSGSVKLKPDFPEAHNNLGLCLNALKRFEQAVASYEKAIGMKPDYAEAYNNLGLTLQDQGLWEQAIEKFETAIALKPDHSGAHYNLGFALNELGEFDGAVLHYRRSVQLKPDFADAHNNLGAILKNQGRIEEAVSHYRMALGYSSDKAEIYNNLGNALEKGGRGLDTDAGFEFAARHYKAGRLSQALELFHRILQVDPKHSQTLHILGVDAHQKGNYNKALTLIGRALAIDPQKPHYYYNFGLVCSALGEPQAAINAYRRAIQLKPDYIEAYGSLGAALKDQMRFDEALDLFDQILKIVPGEPKIHYGRGQVLSAQGQYDKAIEAFDRAISLNPEIAIFYNSLGIARGLSGDQSGAMEAFNLALNLQPDLAEAVNNQGTAMQEQGQFDRALDYFNRAIQIRPDYGEARFNRAAIQLLNGSFESGWRDYEGRSQQPAWKRDHNCPETISRWDGSSFNDKRLYVHSEQGLGDTLQFVRYLPLVKALGGRVILETSELLVELFKGLKSVDEFVVQGSDNLKAADYDMCVHLLSLPGLFKTTLGTIPENVPYIAADSIKVSYWKNKLTDRELKVGLVWAGNPTHKKDRHRSIEFRRFHALGRIPGLRLYGLQKGDAALQTEKMADIMEIRNFGDELFDFSDTAALIDNLDLVVSVDTAVAHLAGSMGKPIWVMLPYVPDWRWMLDRDDSPWYPTMRLFRQPEKGNWDAVLGRLSKELEAFVSSKQ